MQDLSMVSKLQPKLTQMETVTGSTRIDKPNLAIPGEEEEPNASFSHTRNLPPWGEVVIDENQDSKYVNVGALAISKGKGITEEQRVHLLEEMDEELLSNRVVVLSRNNKIRSALEIFWSMELLGVCPNVQACNSLIACLLRNGLLDEGLKVFGFVRKRKIATGHTFSLVLKAVANAQGCESSLKMFMELEGECDTKKDFDAVVYNTMISICGKVKNWVEIERIWRSMKANECTGTQDTMQAIIGGCTKEGKWDTAVSVFQKMLKVGIKPNLIACNAVINSLGKAGEVKLAFQTYDIMESLGHTPDAYTFNALLSTLYKANRHDDVLQLFENVQKKQACQLNTHLYNTVLMSCSKLGLWNRALQILWHMEASELSVLTASYNLVISACEVAHKPEIALQVYDRMVHQKCNPDTFTYLSLIRSCIWGSLWDEVEEILHYAEPDVSLYNAAIQGMCLRGKVGPAKKLYIRMREIGLQPDGKTWALMLQNLPRD
ncbi:Pentatricopeptide repeat [Quillaja saponaria]|uniref:Pentatricopeptide repeat n=1 Tax=Quillaja saponaria TaxID=32244 RepID=A0AAD7VCW7_QUISA|nr:Pentatricopeptide repeat [Quillaja saponaria]